MDKNQVEGTAKDVVGKVKDGAGGLTGDVGLQAEGKGDQLAGKVQKKLGNTIDAAAEGVQAVTAQAGDLKDSAGEKLAEISDKVRTTTSDLATQARDLKDSAGEKLLVVSDKVRTTTSDFAAQAADLTQRTGRFVGETVQRQPLLSLIGIAAIGYAVGFLMHSPTSPLTEKPRYWRR